MKETPEFGGNPGYGINLTRTLSPAALPAFIEISGVQQPALRAIWHNGFMYVENRSLTILAGHISATRKSLSADDTLRGKEKTGQVLGYSFKKFAEPFPDFVFSCCLLVQFNRASSLPNHPLPPGGDNHDNDGDDEDYYSDNLVVGKIHAPDGECHHRRFVITEEIYYKTK